MNKKLKITLLGLGLSTSSLAVFLKNQGFLDVFISEIKPKQENEFYSKIHELGYISEFGVHSEKVYKNRELIISSPGFPPDSEIMINIKNSGIPIISDIEFIYNLYPDKKYIAITGSNGKSTTTSLIYHILKSYGINVDIGGNIGIPISDIILKNKEVEYIVLETSSYQLELTKHFKADISIFLNVSPNHLIHHKNMENYILAKVNIFKNQNNHDHLILDLSHDYINNHLKHFKGTLHTFSFSDNSDIYIKDMNIFHNKKRLFKLDEIKLRGNHNLENIMASVMAAIILKIPYENIRSALKTFSPLEHRFEHVCTIDGAEIINDSKSTTIISLKMALNCIDKDKGVILLAGGTDKNTSLEPLRNIASKKIKYAILYGEAGPRFYDFFSNVVDSFLEKDLKSSFEKALTLSKNGNTILLSPACASFDEFKNFEERGKYFKEIALQSQKS